LLLTLKFELIDVNAEFDSILVKIGRNGLGEVWKSRF